MLQICSAVDSPAGMVAKEKGCVCECVCVFVRECACVCVFYEAWQIPP